jgi:uncharacterized protein
MGKLLLLLLIGLAFFVAWKLAARGARTRRRTPPPHDPERMVGCRECGVHLPLSEAVEADGNYFCSDDHRRMFVR